MEILSKFRVYTANLKRSFDVLDYLLRIVTLSFNAFDYASLCLESTSASVLDYRFFSDGGHLIFGFSYF